MKELESSHRTTPSLGQPRAGRWSDGILRQGDEDDGHSSETPVRRRRIPRKLYRIGEIVDYSGVSRQTIHNYTIMGLIRECDWTRGGHRLYDEEVFDRLDSIAGFKAQHKTLGFIQEFFARQDAEAGG